MLRLVGYLAVLFAGDRDDLRFGAWLVSAWRAMVCATVGGLVLFYALEER